jgi:hypothetical protein
LRLTPRFVVVRIAIVAETCNGRLRVIEGGGVKFMDKKTKKRFTLLAAAGMLLARGVSAIPIHSNVTDRVDSALQDARDELRLSVEDIDALGSFAADGDDMMIGIY